MEQKLNFLEVAKQEKTVMKDTTVKSLIEAFNHFCAGNSVVLYCNNALMQILSINENNEEK